METRSCVQCGLAGPPDPSILSCARCGGELVPLSKAVGSLQSSTATMDDAAFADAALQGRFVTRAQVDECLKTQRAWPRKDCRCRCTKSWS